MSLQKIIAFCLPRKPDCFSGQDELDTFHKS